MSAFEIFRAALDHEGPERERFLDEACEGNADLRAQVLELLGHDEAEDTRFDEAKIHAHREKVAELAPQLGPAPSEAAPLPEFIDEYKIVRRLGAGGMGVVYEALQESPRRAVALKVLGTGNSTPKHRARFRQEIQVLGRLQHPGIAHIHGAGTYVEGDVERPYFVMELVEGRSLTAWARKANPTQEDKLALFAKICDAVHHAHTKGVVHRDLKPDNVLVTEAGRPIVLDFGVARAMDSDIFLSTAHTVAGQLLGTVAYMSPEQANGDARSLDALSDVYTLGVLLFELLSGRLPHEVSGQAIPEAVRTIQQDEPTHLSSISTTLRGDLTTITHRALEKDPKRRYPSAAALGADVRRFLAHKPIKARPTSRMYLASRFVRRHRGFSLGMFLTVISLVSGLAISIVSLAEQRRLRRAAELREYMLELARAESIHAIDFAREIQERFTQMPPERLGWEARFLIANPAEFTWKMPVGTFEPRDIQSLDIRVAVSITPDASRVATFLDNHAIGVFATTSGELLFRVEETAQWVPHTIAINNKALAAATEDGRVRIIDLEDGREILDQAIDTEDGEISVEWDGGLELFTYTNTEVLRNAPAAAPPADWRTGVIPHTFDLVSIRPKYRERPDSLNAWTRSLEAGYALDTNLHGVVRLFRISHKGELNLELPALMRAHNVVVDLAISATRAAVVVDSTADESAPTVVSLFSVPQGQFLSRFEFDGRGGCALDPRSRVLAVRTDSELMVHEFGSGRSLAGVQPTYLYDVDFTPDGKTIVVRDFYLGISIWDARDLQRIGEIARPIVKHQDWENTTGTIGVSADNTRVVTLGNFGHVLEADLAVDTELVPRGVLDERVKSDDFALAPWLEFLGGPVSTRTIAVDPTGRFAYYKARVVEVAGEETLFEVPVLSDFDPLLPRHSDSTAAFSPDGERVAIVRRGIAKVFDVQTGAVLFDLKEPDTFRLWSVAWSPDGTRLATGSHEGKIAILETESFERLLTLRGHTEYVHDLAWSPDGTQLASVSGDKTLRVWDSESASMRAEQAAAAAAIRDRMRPRVTAWVEESDDLYAVAVRIRNAAELNTEERHEALRVLRELATR